MSQQFETAVLQSSGCQNQYGPPALVAFQMSTPSLQAASPFGWVKDDHGDSSCVPIVDFDYDSVFKRMDGEVSDEPRSPKRPQLCKLLSPRELQHALAVSRNILKRSSHEYKTRCATWRNPEIRARRIAGMRRAWKYRDHQIPRKLALKLWRERRSEMISRINATMRNPRYRRLASERMRASWADPEFRQRRLARLRDPELRRRAADFTKLYFERHPEVRQKNADRLRALWRNPDFRQKMIRLVSATNKRRNLNPKA
jgi:hypothetical protein